MPIYSHSSIPKLPPICFIHIPKAGGTTVESFFSAAGFNGFLDPQTYREIKKYMRNAPAHFDYDQLSGLFKLEYMYVFAVIRNPLNRFISHYLWAASKSNLRDKVVSMSISEYAKYAFDRYSENPNFFSSHIKPQVDFVGPKVNDIFKLEDGLELAIKSVLKACGLKADKQIILPTENKSSSNKPKIDSNTEHLIYDFYKKDFEVFNY